MAEGTVPWFNDTKGFGFIESDDGQDALVQNTAIVGEGRKPLKEGDRVQLDLQCSDQGP